MQLVQTTHLNVPSEKGIKPLNMVGSLLIFGIPTLIMFLSFHLGIPALEGLGLTSFEAFIVTTTVPTAVMFAAAIAAVTVEQNITSFSEFREVLRTRMRFPRLTLKTVLKGIGLYLIVLLFVGLITFAIRTVLKAQAIPLPEYIPVLLNPTAEINLETLTTFVGGQLVGNWGIILLYGLQFFFNNIGEELWWRGYVLPRQELAFGRYAWLVHGLMWWGFHAFKWWDLMTVLPLALIFSFVAQRTKNNWIITIAHMLGNILLPLILLAGILGTMS